MKEEKFSKIKEKLNEIAKFEGEVNHVDKYYTPKHRNFVEPEHPFEWLSIRDRGQKTILNYKHYYPENSAETTHCDEYDIKLENGGKIEKVFSALDLRKLVTVRKKRSIYTFQNKFEIAMDEVEGLGNFIEVEAIKDFGSVEKTREKLHSFAERLGVDISNEDHKGYPRMLMLEKGLL